MDIRIVSIGALSAHPLRGEGSGSRLGHGTTTLVRSGDATILVDPGLPAQVLVPRLEERTGLGPEAITHVFLTSFNPELRRGITAFENAEWLIGEREREAVGVPLATSLRDATEDGDSELVGALETEVAILHRCSAAPDKIADQVDLFPLPGMSPGLCGLLLPEARLTTLICGDAVATLEHLEQGKVLSSAADVDQARESFTEAIEIADVLVPGRDNLVINPTRRPF